MTSESQSAPDPVWQPPVLMKVVAVLWMILAVVLSVWATHAAKVEMGSVMGMAAFSLFVFLLPALAAAWLSFRCQTRNSGNDLVVRTMFGTRTIPWNDIAEVAPDRSGARLHLKDGTTYLTGAMYGFELRSLIGNPKRGIAFADWIAQHSGAKRIAEVRWTGPIDRQVDGPVDHPDGDLQDSAQASTAS